MRWIQANIATRKFTLTFKDILPPYFWAISICEDVERSFITKRPQAVYPTLEPVEK